MTRRISISFRLLVQILKYLTVEDQIKYPIGLGNPFSRKVELTDSEWVKYEKFIVKMPLSTN